MLEVLVVGAGPAGTATALALRTMGVEPVELVEESLPGGFKLGEAATPDVMDLLHRLGVAPLANQGLYVGNISSFDGPVVVDDFLHRGLPCGQRLDRTLFDEHLVSAARDAGARLARPLRLRRLRREEDGWVCELSEGAKRRARYLVDATGRRSAVAVQLGAKRQPVDRLVALAQRVPAEVVEPLGPRVMVAACSLGWWYATALPDGSGILSLMTDGDLAPRALEGWRGALLATEVLVERLGVLPEAGPLRATTANSACLDRAAGRGWLAVGDALMSFDPLTSSGISGALRDGIAAATEVLVPWLRGEAPEGPGRAWGARANRTFQRFLAERARIYGQVRAFPGEPFWERRR